jgi:crossover junction endodeoxyribonuclease RusA
VMAIQSCTRFVVPGDPIPKARARVMAGYAYTPKRTRVAEATVAAAAKAAGVYPTTYPVRLSATFYRGSARRCDLDNLIKLVQDALNGIAYVDDQQIMTLVAEKHIDRESPRTDIQVEVLTP